MVLCLVFGCGSRSDRDKRIGFYRLPSVVSNKGEFEEELTTERREKWIKAISMVIMGLTGLRDSHVRVLALVKVLPSRVYLLENTLFSMKWVVPLVKCSFSAGFCHLWFGGFA